MSKYCRKCWNLNENPLLKYCMRHIELNYKLKRTPVKQISKKKTQRLKETWWEKATFKKVDEVDKICWITWKYINEPASFTFPHLLEKSKFPAFRLIQNNIWRAYWIEEHNKLDEKMSIIKRDLQKLQEFKKLLLDWSRKEVKLYLQLNTN